MSDYEHEKIKKAISSLRLLHASWLFLNHCKAQCALPNCLNAIQEERFERNHLWVLKGKRSMTW